MIFDTHIDGIECQCEVVHYRPYVPVRIAIPIEDSEEAMLSEFTFVLRDRCGHMAPALQELVTKEDEKRLQDEYEAIVMANKHGKEY